MLHKMMFYSSREGGKKGKETPSSVRTEGIPVILISVYSTGQNKANVLSAY